MKSSAGSLLRGLTICAFAVVLLWTPRDLARGDAGGIGDYRYGRLFVDTAVDGVNLTQLENFTGLTGSLWSGGQAKHAVHGSLLEGGVGLLPDVPRGSNDGTSAGIAANDRGETVGSLLANGATVAAFWSLAGLFYL